MPVETDADRALFLDADDFGVEAAWTHAGGTTTLAGIFDAEYQVISSPFLDAGAEGSGPQLIVRSADVPAQAKQKNVVTIGAKTFRVVEFKPDGTGMTVVRLQEG